MIFLSSFVLYFPTRKSTGTPTGDLEIGREVAFPFVKSLLGNFAVLRRTAAENGLTAHEAPIHQLAVGGFGLVSRQFPIATPLQGGRPER